MRGRWAVLGALALGWVMLDAAAVLAQPVRNFPGSRPVLPGSPVPQFPPPNDRVRQAASQVGFQSADFYAKNGYPKVLGDAVEQGSVGGGQAGGQAGAGGQTGGQTGGRVDRRVFQKAFARPGMRCGRRL